MPRGQRHHFRRISEARGFFSNSASNSPVGETQNNARAGLSDLLK
jgi:hypothetical protein